MALRYGDRVLETTTSTGTGALALAGAITGYRRFSAIPSIATSDTVYYSIFAVDANGNPTGDWETGLGTYSAANTLTRTTVHESSNNNAAVSFGAGTKYVMATPNATAIGALTNYTDEQVRDVIGTALVAGSGIAITPNDGSDTITIASTAASNNYASALNTMRPLTDFTQINISGSRSVAETSGKRITITESTPDTTLRIVGLRRAAPGSTPYRVAVFVQLNSAHLAFSSLSYGWSNGTAYDVIQSCENTGNVVEIQNWTNSTSRASVSGIGNSKPFGTGNTGFWIGLRDDGTRAFWEISADGVNFSTVRVVTKSGSSPLGASGFTNCYVGLFVYNTALSSNHPVSLTIREWDESGLTRTF